MPTLFEAIDDNTRHGASALIQTLRQAKRQVAENRHAEVTITERLAVLLLAAQYESRLNWLLNHPDSRLSTPDIAYVRKAGGISKKWNALLRASLALRKNLRDNTSYRPDDIPAVLDLAERGRYWRMHRIATDHLDMLIDVRNSLAHGEWVTALTPNADAINLARTASLRSLSLYRVVILTNLLDHLWRAHFDAQVTRTAFERDFDKHATGMINAARRLERGDEQRWLANMRRSYEHGRATDRTLTVPN
jgi:hypothetical protein